MATEYNVNSPAYTNKISMENSEFAQSAKPSQSQMHGLECAPAEGLVKNLFTRTAGLSSTSLALQDKRLYDFATFQIATAGGQAANIVVGELWVTYLIEFLKPQIPTTLGGDLDTLKINGTESAVTAIRITDNLSNSTTNTVTGSLGYSIAASGIAPFTESLTLTRMVIGNLYQISSAYACSQAITTAPAWSITSGATAKLAYPSGTAFNANSTVSINGGGTGACQFMITFTASASTVVLSLTNGLLAASGNYFGQHIVSGLDSTITN